MVSGDPCIDRIEARWPLGVTATCQVLPEHLLARIQDRHTNEATRSASLTLRTRNYDPVGCINRAPSRRQPVMLTRETITVGAERFRVTPWHAGTGVAHLALAPRQVPPQVDSLRSVLETLRERGYDRVITSAMAETETAPFEALGFVEDDRLHVLEFRLDQSGRQLPDRPREIKLRRAGRADRERALALDAQAFEPFWRLDAEGLADAEEATPHSRFRVATIDRTVAGYAITGRGGDSGFLQRLATDPRYQRRGVATALVGDSLRWCARHRARQVFVNTQVVNKAALALYLSLGFVATDHDLIVLSWSTHR